MNSIFFFIIVVVGGFFWWNGFIVDFIIINIFIISFSNWIYIFDIVYKIFGNFWGVIFISVDLGNGIICYILIGVGWVLSIFFGGFVIIGFNGIQGMAIGNSGFLIFVLLFIDVNVNIGGIGGEYQYLDFIFFMDLVVDFIFNFGIGRVFVVNFVVVDIVGFNFVVDRLDFGDVLVYNFIFGKISIGKVVIINFWVWIFEFQIIWGVSFDDLIVVNFGIVQNEYLWQDIGGVFSWELGLGVRNSNMVYVCFYEYGVQEWIENFNFVIMKLSFFYYGIRERLIVSDMLEGLLIVI